MVAVGADFEQRQDAQTQLFQSFVAPAQLVVVFDARGQIRVGGPPAQQRRMALNGQPRVQPRLHDLHHARARVDHAHVVHHLGHADDARPGQHFGHLRRAEVCARGLFAGHRGHAAGNHDVDAQGQALAGFDHEADAVHAQHVGDLVGVDDGGGGAEGEHARGIARRGDHGALDVQVGVHETGRGPLACAVDDAGRVQRVFARHAHQRDAVAVDADVGRVDFAGEDVDQVDVEDGQIQRACAHGGLDEFGAVHGNGSFCALAARGRAD